MVNSRPSTVIAPKKESMVEVLDHGGHQDVKRVDLCFSMSQKSFVEDQFCIPHIRVRHVSSGRRAAQ